MMSVVPNEEWLPSTMSNLELDEVRGRGKWGRGINKTAAASDGARSYDEWEWLWQLVRVYISFRQSRFSRGGGSSCSRGKVPGSHERHSWAWLSINYKHLFGPRICRTFQDRAADNSQDVFAFLFKVFFFFVFKFY